MDNITHTLVGAALGEAGLKRQSGLAMAALLIGANLPDVDAIYEVLAKAWTFRRGLTHGVLALVERVFPVLPDELEEAGGASQLRPGDLGAAAQAEGDEEAALVRVLDHAVDALQRELLLEAVGIVARADHADINVAYRISGVSPWRE